MQEAPHPVSPVSHASRYNTLHFASKVVCQWGQAPFGNPHKKRRYAPLLHGGAYRLFLLSSPPAVSVEQKSAWDWCGIFNFEIPRFRIHVPSGSSCLLLFCFCFSQFASELLILIFLFVSASFFVSFFLLILISSFIQFFPKFLNCPGDGTGSKNPSGHRKSAGTELQRQIAVFRRQPSDGHVGNRRFP